MQKKQLVNWVSNIIKTKVIPNDSQVLYELEAKIGKFKGNNYQTNQQLSQIKGMEQLDKTNLKYQFESKITFQQYNNALSYLKQKEQQKIIQRIDFSLNKQQRSSFQLTNQQFDAILIEKQKNTSQHIDIVQDQINYRISLNQEKTLSTSPKDIIAQMPSRKQHANFIRLKETLFIREENLEFALSKVQSLNKSDPNFIIILDLISNSKLYDIQDKMIQLFRNQIFKEYEFEIEVAQNKNLNDEQINNLSQLLIQKIEQFWAILQNKQHQENEANNPNDDGEKQIVKKVKVNDIE